MLYYTFILLPSWTCNQETALCNDECLIEEKAIDGYAKRRVLPRAYSLFHVIDDMGQSH